MVKIITTENTTLEELELIQATQNSIQNLALLYIEQLLSQE